MGVLILRNNLLSQYLFVHRFCGFMTNARIISTHISVKVDCPRACPSAKRFLWGEQSAPNLVNGPIRAFALRQAYHIRVVNLRKRIGLDNIRTNGGMQSSVQNTVICVKRKVRDLLPLGTILRQQIVDILLAESFSMRIVTMI